MPSSMPGVALRLLQMGGFPIPEAGGTGTGPKVAGGRLCTSFPPKSVHLPLASPLPPPAPIPPPALPANWNSPLLLIGSPL